MLVLELLGSDYTADQGNMPFVPSLGLPGGHYKVICSWLLIVLDLGVLGKGYAVN